MYYLIEISTGDSKIDGKAIYSFETEREAVASFHTKLGTAMKSDLYETEIVMIIDDDAQMVKREKYVKDNN